MNYLKLNIKQNHQVKLNSIIPYILLTLIFLQIIIGAFVSGMDAGPVYNSTLMGNTYFPDDNKFINLFELSAFSDAFSSILHRNLALLF